MKAPLIDPRTQAELVAELRAYISAHATEWPTTAAVAADPMAETFAQIFGRLTEVVLFRLNRVPDKNFLAFLRMLGMDLAAPRAARAPLHFRLARSATGGLVPAGTQVAVEGTENKVIFETSEDLSLVLPQITRAVSIEGAKDRYTDHTGLFDAEHPATASLFEGSTLVPHRLYLGHPSLFAYDGTATVQLEIELKYPLLYSANDWAVKWYSFDADTGVAVPITVEPTAPSLAAAALLRSGTAILNAVKTPGKRRLRGPGEKAVTAPGWPTIDRETSWIFAELSKPLPARFAQAANIAAARLIANDAVITPTTGTIAPFPKNPLEAGASFYIGSTEVFTRKDATIILRVELDPVAPAPDTTDVVLELHYHDGSNWAFLGETSEAGVPTADPMDDLAFVDTTNAFTASGQIRFFCPAFGSSVIENLTSTWLRVRLKSGGYGETPTLKPPIFSSLRLEYTAVPEISTIKASVQILTTEAVPLKSALFNTSVIDLSRDFYPFGERPKFNDTFYIAAPGVFDKADATITIVVKKSPGVLPAPTPGTNLQLTWEYFNGEKWVKFAVVTEAGPEPEWEETFSDSTAAFTSDGSIIFDMPADAKPVNLRGQEEVWLRVRITEGNYGADPDYKPPSIESWEMNINFSAETDPAVVVFENNFFLKDRALLADNATTETDIAAIFTANATADPEDVRYLAPFVAPPETQATLYLGFDADIANLPLNILFPLISQPFNADLGTASANPPVLIWEYWTGTLWATASADDRTNNLSRKEIAQVLVPADSAPRPVFGDDRSWLRLRLDRGEFTLKPEIEKFYTNVVWSENGVTVREEILGSGNGQPGRAFTLTRRPVLEGQRVIVLEDALTEEDRSLIRAEEGADAIQEITTAAGEITSTRVRWHQVNQFEFSSPRSRHYTIDRATGRITFGDGQRGLIPPAGSNNILCEFYRWGTAGNVTGGVNQPLAAFDFVEGVDNPFLAEGGVDQESLDLIRERGPRSIKNRGRGVTFEDFEALAGEASGQVARVRALQTTDTSFIFRPGHVTVIIVPDTDDLKPFPSRELVNAVEEYLSARTSGFLQDALAPKINVVGPGYLQVRVEVDVNYTDIARAKQIELAIRKALNAFLNPLTGGPAGGGWPFGRAVYISEIYKTIEDVDGVDFADNVVLRGSEQMYDLRSSLPLTPQIPYPAGSQVEIRRAETGAFMRYRLATRLKEDETTWILTVTGFKEGDFVDLTTPTPSESEVPLKLLVRSVTGNLLEIDPTVAQDDYPIGSRLTSSDGRTIATITTAVADGSTISALVTDIPAPGDTFQLTRAGSTTNVEEGTLDQISDETRLIFLDENYLVYPGAHTIRAAQPA